MALKGSIVVPLAVKLEDKTMDTNRGEALLTPKQEIEEVVDFEMDNECNAVSFDQDVNEEAIDGGDAIEEVKVEKVKEEGEEAAAGADAQVSAAAVLHKISVKPFHRGILLKAKFPIEALEDVNLSDRGEDGDPPPLISAHHLPDLSTMRDAIEVASELSFLVRPRRALLDLDWDLLAICWNCGVRPEHTLPVIAPTKLDPVPPRNGAGRNGKGKFFLKSLADAMHRRLGLSVLYGRPAWHEHVRTVMKSTENSGCLALVRHAMLSWGKAIKTMIFAADSSRLGPAIGVKPNCFVKMELNEVRARARAHKTALEARLSLRVLRAAGTFQRELGRLRAYKLDRRCFKLAVYAQSLGVTLEEEGEGDFPPVAWPGTRFDARALVSSWRVLKKYAVDHQRNIADVASIGPRPEELPPFFHLDVKEKTYEDPIMAIRDEEGVDDDLMAYLATSINRIIVPKDAKDFAGPPNDPDVMWDGNRVEDSGEVLADEIFDGDEQNAEAREPKKRKHADDDVSDGEGHSE